MTADYRLQSLDDPTAVIQELYRAHPTPDNFPRFVAEHFQNLFDSPNMFKRIPILDVRRPPESHRDRAVVRFRAMVQDTSLSTEMYLSKFSDGSCGGWGIYETEGGSSSSSPEVEYTNLRECSVLWATSVPAESKWCADELNGLRIVPGDSSSVPTSTAVSPWSYKYPHAESGHVGVQVKLYDREGAESYKSTEVVTFVGILSSEPCSLDHTSASPSDAPTLHVLFTQSHSPTFVDRPFRQERPAQDAHVISSADSQSSLRVSEDNSQVREQLISWIADEALGGDRVAAEWVLLSCISKGQSRHPPLHPPSLTVSRFPSPPVPTTTASTPSPAPALSTVLQLLLPLLHTLPLSLDTLNKSHFVPESKDEDLHAGVLQLPHGTVLLVTEGDVTEGQFLERGVMNVRALQDVMDAQTLPYIFPFSQFSFPTDVSCIVLSEGRKSAFFRTDLNVPLRAPTTPAAISALYKPADEVRLPSADKLAAFRDLVVGARGGKVQVPEATSED
ncbi:Mini-chromosome maintenance complex-binding protein [Trametes pubescens]|uniref:Mini-chromosome maintenance complex-binding protein n=1 Tax=Trametes pubescens TaxID=154538 RepID=A0A1M2W2U9_TRAPU|nr:Mini-chromosome maintenance complex-binding protein [Trametes pubescens]